MRTTEERVDRVRRRRLAAPLIVIVLVAGGLGLPLPPLNVGTTPSVEVRAAQGPQPDQWPAYGGDPGGTRYSALTQIAHRNVGDLQVAWTYRTCELGHGAASASSTLERQIQHGSSRATGRTEKENPQDGLRASRASGTLASTSKCCTRTSRSSRNSSSAG